MQHDLMYNSMRVYTWWLGQAAAGREPTQQPQDLLLLPPLQDVSVQLPRCTLAPLPHPQDVSVRACYLFCRLSKALRQQLSPVLHSLLPSLQPHLERVATTPLMDQATQVGLHGVLVGSAWAS